MSAISSETPAVPLRPQHNVHRTVRSLDGVWAFCREKVGVSHSRGFVAEKHVAVPASINDLFTEEELRSHRGGMWLSRSFFMEDRPGVRWLVHFGAAAFRAEVFVNGCRVGGHEGGSTPFAFDITTLVVPKRDNLLCVRLDGVLSPDTVPQGNLPGLKADAGQIAHQYPSVGFDFYPYIGLHRSVTLCSTGCRAWIEEIALEPQGDLVSGRATLRVNVRAGGCGRVLIVRVPEREVCMSIEGDSAWSAELALGNVEWWSPDSPRLYRCELTLCDANGEELDSYTGRFGVRVVTIQPDGLHLNGRRFPLRGFGLHEDFPVIGKGHNDAVMIRNFELLRWTGANSFRTTHYPYAEEVLDYADEVGVLVIGECAAVSINFDFTTPATLAAHQRNLHEMMLRDRNHPCVVAWSLGNEANSNRAAARPYFEQLVGLARTTDPMRPITFVSCWPEDDVVLPLCDFVCLNLYPGWYHLPGQISAAVEDMERVVVSAHRRYGKPIVVSEFGADAVSGLHALPAEQWTEDYQADLIVALSRKLAELPFVFGQHVWNLADFRTAQHHFRVNGNRKGVFTRDRQPKLAARLLREEWARQTR